MRFLAVDPGLANTGLVLFEGQRIVSVWTLRSAAEGPRPDFATAVRRSQEMAAELDSIRELAGELDAVVVEAYRDIPGALRKASNRWTTPLTIGVLVPALQAFGVPLVWQDPEHVMTTYKQAVRLWALGQHGICPGDEKLRNEHLRSAAAHGLFFLSRQRVRS